MQDFHCQLQNFSLRLKQQKAIIGRCNHQRPDSWTILCTQMLLCYRKLLQVPQLSIREVRFAEEVRCSCVTAFTSFESLKRLQSLYAGTIFKTLKSLETQKQLPQCNPRIKKAKKVGKKQVHKKNKWEFSGTNLGIKD